ncbi:MAG: hypothetical protein QG634_246 [Patescibacteria group bacterium]|nr:hypothetical protein [Patescibacteria group bacterium]
MTTITFEEDIKIAKTNFKNLYDFNQYLDKNSFKFEIPEMSFIEYNKLNIEDKKLFDNINSLDRSNFTNI